MLTDKTFAIRHVYVALQTDSTTLLALYSCGD
jgi:hypothetical protein